MINYGKFATSNDQHRVIYRTIVSIDYHLIAAEISYLSFKAGRDTSSNSLTLTLYELSQHPEIVDKMFNEVMEVCGHEEITWDHVHKMEFVL
jgi:hypothetical protein